MTKIHFADGHFRAHAAMKLKLDPSEPWMFKHDKLRQHVLAKCWTAHALAVQDSEVAHTAPGVCPYSIPAGVPRPQMPVVVNIRPIPGQETPAPAEVVEELPFTKTENIIDTKMHTMINAFLVWAFQMNTVNEPRYGG